MTNKRLQNKVLEGFRKVNLCYTCLDVDQWNGASLLGMKGCDKCGNYVNEADIYTVYVPEEVYYEW